MSGISATGMHGGFHHNSIKQIFVSFCTLGNSDSHRNPVHLWTKELEPPKKK